jgi:hypothetical protein
VRARGPGGLRGPWAPLVWRDLAGEAPTARRTSFRLGDGAGFSGGGEDLEGIREREREGMHVHACIAVRYVYATCTHASMRETAEAVASLGGVRLSPGPWHLEVREAGRTVAFGSRPFRLTAARL